MSAESAPTLAAGDVALRAPISADIEARLRAGRDEGLVRGYGGEWKGQREFTRDDAQRWFHRVAGRPIAWTILVAEEAVGNCHLEIELARPRCGRLSIGIWSAARRGRGYGTTASKLVLTHAFSDLDLHRVELRVLERNVAAVKCYGRCGFSVEGKERETVFLDGEWQNELIMAILKPDWLERQTQVRP